MTTAALMLALMPLILVTSFFCLEVATGLSPLKMQARLNSSPSVVIVIPAHDEALIIGETLRQLRTAMGPNMRILVIADNCSDATAATARAEGAQVLERRNPSHRGKGYALGFAVEQLESCAPEVMVVLDADCSIDAASLHRIAAAAAECGRPCQAVNLLRADRRAAALVQISGFAFMLKNLVRQRGLQRLAGRVHLTGTGMAIPYKLLTASTLSTPDIVEDLGLGLDMAERGYAPKLIPDALVESAAASVAETFVQRRRWEGGFITTSFRRAPMLLVRAVRSGDLRLFLGAIDLMVPPLALLAFVNLCGLVAAVVVTALLGLEWAPVVLEAFVILTAALLVLAAWMVEGRRFVSLGVLARIPLYIAWKLPLYLSIARRGAPGEWLRTRR